MSLSEDEVDSTRWPRSRRRKNGDESGTRFNDGDQDDERT